MKKKKLAKNRRGSKSVLEYIVCNKRYTSTKHNQLIYLLLNKLGNELRKSEKAIDILKSKKQNELVDALSKQS